MTTIASVQEEINRRIQENDPENHHKSRIVGDQPNNYDNGQIFMIEKIGL